MDVTNEDGIALAEEIGEKPRDAKAESEKQKGGAKDDSKICQNIFNLSKFDGAAYLVFYIFIPIASTIVGCLKRRFFTNTDAVYYYVTILISIFSCIYDAANRWKSGEKTGRNKKLYLIVVVSAFIAGYCGLMVIARLVLGSASYKLDYCLIAYVLVVAVALKDTLECFKQDIPEGRWLMYVLPRYRFNIDRQKRRDAK